MGVETGCRAYDLDNVVSCTGDWCTDSPVTLSPALFTGELTLMHTDLVAALDIGGTKIAGALVDGSGRLLLRAQRPTPAGQDGDTVMGAVEEVFAELTHRRCGRGRGPSASAARGPWTPPPGNPARASQFADLGDEHLTGMHILGLAGGGVATEVFGKSLLEHQRDALAHHTYGVDGVDQRLGAGLQQIALSERDHQKYQPVRA